MKKTLFLLCALWACCQMEADAQCSFTPTVSGDTILCPNGSGVLKTQVYDAYQWYRKPFFGGAPEAIPGATGQSIAVTEDDLLHFFWVEATLNGCTEISHQVLLDGYVFLLPFVIHEGEYTFDPVTESFKICQGDTMFLTLGLPYDTNITWYKDGLPVPGENASIFAVTETGAYTVSGAPSVCPDFIQPLGISLPVFVEPCATNARPGLELTDLRVYPNPVSGLLFVESATGEQIETIALSDVSGRRTREFNAQGAPRFSVPMDDLSPGTYFLRVTSGQRSTVRKIVKW